MTYLRDNLFKLCDDTNELIERLLAFQVNPENNLHKEEASLLEDELDDAMQHLLKAYSHLLSSSLFLRPCQPQETC